MKAIYLGFALAVVVSLVVSHPVYGQSYDRLGSHCELLECTECHVKEPVWEVDVLETAPLKEGFACTNCHTADTREADQYVLEQLAALPPAVSSSTCNDITVSSHFNSTNGTWSIMVETGGISGNLKHVSAWVQCDIDGDSPCGLSCTSVDRNSECNDSTFALSSASQCISRWCFIPGSWTPPYFIRDGLLLQTSPTPYEIRAYAVSAPECDSAHNWLYHCCDTEILNSIPQLHAEAPPTASAGVPWQMTVTAEDGSGNALVNYAGLVTFSLGQTTTPYSPGPPEAGTRPPLPYTFVPFLGGDAGLRVFNVSSYTAGTVEVIAGDGITTDGVTVQVGPGEPNCVQRLIPDPPKPPKDPPNIEMTSPAGTGGYTIETECPPISVTPPYIPADGVTEATVEVTGITDAYENNVIGDMVTVETTVGTIVTADSVPGVPGVQVPVTPDGTGKGKVTFNVRAGTIGVQGMVKMMNLSGEVVAQEPLTVFSADIAQPNEDDVFLEGGELRFVGNVDPSGLTGVAYAWTVTQGTCDPSVTSGSDFETTLGSEGDITVKLEVTIGGETHEKERTIEAIRPEVVKIHWKNDHNLLQGATGSTAVTDPVWIKTLGGPVTKNEPGAYTMSGAATAELEIEGIRVLSYSTSVQVQGDGVLANDENFFPQGAIFHNWTWSSGELELSSSPLYASVNFYDALEVKWQYRVQDLSGSWGDWVDMNQSAQLLYTVYETPEAPEAPPHVDILDYACRWAVNATGAENVCTSMLYNGFGAHYTWDFDCHTLSSDFVRLVGAIGVVGSQHNWASRGAGEDGDAVGWMCYQRTKSFTPVGGSDGVREWSWHQWAEAAGSQRDPSAAVSLSGAWGAYEDDLFTHYYECAVSVPFAGVWVANQAGQSSGSEAPANRIYGSNPTIHDWRGPDR